MTRAPKLVLAACATFFCQFASSADAAFDPLDFMTMDVCLDDQGKVVIGMSPADPACKSRRDIRPSDPVPYHLTDSGVPETCGERRLLRDNLAWSHDGASRVLGAVSIDQKPCEAADPLIPVYYSVRWFDDVYSFIMGTWTRGADGGKFGGGVTPLCEAHQNDSGRYFRNWVLFPSKEIAPSTVGHGVFSKKGAFSGLSRPGEACPAEYPARYIAFWSRGPFTYTSGVTLDTIVSHPYSQTNAAGLTPGASRQMERTYWTREFGQSRWENWKRDDFINKHVDKNPLQLGADFFSNHTCSPPFNISGEVTRGMRLDPVVRTAGLYNQRVTDVETGETHVWYLVGCQDTTRVVKPNDPAGDPFPPLEKVRPQIWDFWK